jgi:hypothetical protein
LQLDSQNHQSAAPKNHGTGSETSATLSDTVSLLPPIELADQSYPYRLTAYYLFRLSNHLDHLDATNSRLGGYFQLMRKYNIDSGKSCIIIFSPLDRCICAINDGYINYILLTGKMSGQT